MGPCPAARHLKTTERTRLTPTLCAMSFKQAASADCRAVRMVANSVLSQRSWKMRISSSSNGSNAGLARPSARRLNDGRSPWRPPLRIPLVRVESRGN